MDAFKTFIGGVVVIGVIAAIGLHSSGLASVSTSAGKAGSGLLNTAEKG